MARRDGARIFHSSTADFTYAVKADRAATIMRCASASTVVRVPEYIGGYQVTALGPASFSGLEHLSELRCPQTVRAIGEFAFRDCINLMTIEFPERLDAFDVGWVEGCSRLRRVVFPGMAQTVPAQLFERFDVHELRLGEGTRFVRVSRHQPITLEMLEINPANPWLHMDGCGLYGLGGEELIARIESYDCADEMRPKRVPSCHGEAKANDSCEAVYPGQRFMGIRGPLQRSTQDDKHERVFEQLCEASEDASSDCVSESPRLRRFRVADGCRRIGAFAFANQRGLVDVELPNTVEVIGEGAFAGASALSHVTIPASVIEIGPGAFAGTRSLAHLEIPPSVEKIGVGAFADMPALERLVLPAAVCADERQAIACASDRPWETMAACDAAISMIPDVETRARIALVRLKDPLFMAPRAKTFLQTRLADDLPQLCSQIADSGEFSLFDDLADVGVLDADAIVVAIGALSPRRHGDAIARLLHIKHVRFGNSQPDYEI